MIKSYNDTKTKLLPVVTEGARGGSKMSVQLGH